MTDDPSDDRMDRARRIREMREGNRPDADPDADSDPVTDDTVGPDADSDPVTDDTVGPDAESTAEAGTENADGEATAADTAAETDDGPGGVPKADDDPDGTPGAGEDPGDGFPGDWDSPGGTADDEETDDVSAAGVDVPTDEDGVPQLPGIDMGDVDAEALAEQTRLDTGDTGGAGLGTGGEAGAGTTPAAGAGAVTGDADDGGARAVGMAGSSGAVTGGSAEDETRVLEFALGDERYCLDIDHVEEIVKRETVTRVPNTPEYVQGVVDLRGQITTILDPKVLFDIDVEGSEELIVVFDPDGFEDQGAIGWLVDDVNQVMPVADSEVNDSPVDQDHVEGVVDRDGEFVIWTKPELAVEDATS